MSSKMLRGLSRGRSRALLHIALSCALVVAPVTQARAQAIWTGSGDYSTAGNWSTNNVPDAAGESASFANTGGTSITVSSDAAPDSWTFTATSQSYTFNNSGGVITLNGGLTNNASGQTITIGNVLAGTGAVTMNDATGTLVLRGANTYSGGTTINAGTLRVQTAAGTLGSGAVVNNGVLAVDNGGTVANDISGTGSLTHQLGIKILTGTNTYSGTTTITSGVLQIGAGGTAGTLGSGAVTTNTNLIFNRSDTLTVANAISGAGSVSQDGSGTTILTGANSYGDTAISAGILQIGNGGTTGTLGSGGVGNGAALSINRSNAYTIANVISGTGTLTQAGGGTTTLTGVSTYSGLTTISAGTLSLSGSGSIADSSGVANAGTFDISAVTSGASIKALTGAGAVTLGSKALTITAASGTLSGVISGTGGTLTLSGGTQILTGTNTYTGGTTVGNGTLTLGSNAAAGTGAITTTGSVIDYADGVTIANAITLNSNTTQLQVLTVSSATQSGVISETGGSRALEKIGAGTLILTAANTYSGTTTISGTLQIGAGGTSGSLGAGNIVINNAFRINRSDSITLANTISGTGSLVQAGGGTTILTGGNSYGATTISAGTLQIGNNGTAGTLGSGTVTNNAALIFDRSDAVTIANAITGTGSVTFKRTGGYTLTGDSNYSGGTTISEGAITLGNNGTTGMITGNVVSGVTTSNSGINFNRSDNVTFAGDISGLGYVAQQGSGRLTLSGTNSHGAYTAILGGGIAISSASNLGAAEVQLVGGTGGLRINSGITLTNNVQVGAGTVDTNGNTVTLSGVLSTYGGVGNLTKAGAGVLILTGTNTYSGTTTISAGTLQIGSGGTTGALGGGAVTDNGELTINRSNAISIANVVSGSGSLTQAGGGATTLTGVNTYSGATTISAGTLALSGSGSIAASSGVADAGTFDISATTAGASIKTLSGAGTVTLGARTLTVSLGSTTFSGAIGGTGGLTLDTGTLTLSGTNTHSGVTNIANGSATLALTGSGAIANSSSVANSGVLDISGTTTGASITSLSGVGSVTLGSKALTISNAAGGDNFSGVISGATGTLTLSAGTLLLTGANTYGGTTTISAGTLQVGNGGTTGALGAGSISNDGTLAINRSTAITLANAIFGNGSLTKDGGGTLTLTGGNSYTGNTTISAGTLQVGNGGTSGALNGNVVNNAALIFNRSNATLLGTVISGTGTVTKQGTGTLTLSGTHTYTGLTTISAGTLALDTGGSIATSSGVANDATFDISTTTTGATIKALTGAGGVTLGSKALTINTASGTYSGVMSGTGGTLTVSGGTQILTGANSYTGITTISGGTLQVGNGGTTGTLGSGAVTNNAALVFNQTGGITVSNVIGGTGTLTQAGGGGVILTGTNTYSGTTTINASTGGLSIGSGGTSGSLGSGDVVNHAGLTFNRSDTITVANNISGSANLTKSGGGTTILTGSNSYAATNANTGTLQIGNGGTSGTLGTGTVNLTGALVFNRTDTITVGNVINGTGTLAQSGSGTVILAGANGYSGGTTVGAGTLRLGHSNAAGTGTITTTGSVVDYAPDVFILNALVVSSNTTQLQVTTGSAIQSGVISEAGGSRPLEKIGAGKLILTADNTYTGATIITAGTLQIGIGGVVGSTGTLGAGSVTNNGALVFNRNNAATVTNGISGTGSLTQAGSGNLTLTGTKTYTGATSVTAGTLSVNGSIATSSGVTVASGGTLGGTGTVSATTIQSGGTLAPGNSIGTLNVSGNLTFNSGSTFAVELSDVASDLVLVSGNAGLAGTVATTFQGGVTYTARQYTLLTTTGTASGTFSGLTGTVAGFTSALSYDSKNVYLTLTATSSSSSGSLGSTSASTANFTSGGTTGITGTNQAVSLNFVGGTSAATVNLTGSAGSPSSLTVGAGGITNASNNTPTINVSGVSGGTATLTFNFAGNAANTNLTAGNFGTILFTGATEPGSSATLTASSGGTVNFSGGAGPLSNGQLSAGSIAGAGNFVLGANTLTTGGLNTSTSLSGVISGTGGLSKTGTGTLTLTGTNTYTGSTTITGGSLSVNGSITSNVNVTGGNLKGTGTVGGVTIGNGGTIAPGNSIGTLNTGSVTFAAGSVYQNEVNAAGQTDLINASGTAALNGSVQVLPEAGTYAPVTTYRILNAAGGVSGTFTSVTSSVATLAPTLIYGTGSVDLRLVRTDVQFASYGSSLNQTAVGNAVTAGGASSALYLNVGTAVSAAASNGPAALDALSGEVHATLTASQFEAATGTRRQMLSRMRTADNEAGWSLWGNVSGNWGKMDGNANAAGATSNGVAVTLGADTRIGQNWRAGLTGTYAASDLKIAARASSASVKSGQFGAYAHGRYDRLVLRTGFAYGMGKADTSRIASFTGFTDTLTARQDVDSEQLFGEMGYDFAMGSFVMEPFAGMAWTRVKAGALRETGGAAALSGTASNRNDGFSTLGLQFFAADASGGIAPNLRLGWQHAFNNRLASRSLSFLGTGQGFTVLGTPLDADRALLDLDASVMLGGSASATLGYSGSLSTHAQDHGVRLMLAVGL